MASTSNNSNSSEKAFGTLTGKKIAILGFSFKANTNDTRESAAITICKDLLEEGAFLAINDPKVSPNQISKDLGSAPVDIPLFHNKEPMLESFIDKWHFEKDLYKSVENADAVIVLTEWEEYSKIKWDLISSKMRSPAWVFDARSIVLPNKVIDSGLNLWRVGDGVYKT